MHKLTELKSAFGFEAEPRDVFPWLVNNPQDRKTVHIIGMGDVGQNAAIGLRIAGGSCIRRIGLYDVDEKLLSRMEMELNQVLFMPDPGSMPSIRIIEKEDLFQCDVVLFCATKSVPQIGSEKQLDVRLAQFDANRQIISLYAGMAAEKGFRGLFGVVSDPLDLLCAEAAKYLPSYQIEGFGLGVMFARASYYASKRAANDSRFADFPLNGRVFGPHGNGLVAANSIRPEQYDDAASGKLTNLAVGANIAIRTLGYKPYIAPGISSVSLTLPEALSGRWHDGARCLNGVFFGARCKMTPGGTKWENDPLPAELFHRLKKSYAALDEKTRR